MDGYSRERTGESRTSCAWQFAQVLLGNSVPNPSREQTEARTKREQLEWLARISPDHESQLRASLREQAAATAKRSQMEWLAQISPEHETELRHLLAAEAEAAEVSRRFEQFLECSEVHEAQWDPGEHPRRGGPPNAGWFATKGGTASGSGFKSTSAQSGSDAPTTPFRTVGYKRRTTAAKAKSRTGARPQAGGKHAAGQQKGSSTTTTRRGTGSVAQDASNPSRWYLPAEDKGTWSGTKGNSTLRLKTPLDVNGRLIREIEYVDGVPVLDKFALPGKTATVVLTGDRITDTRNAEAAWKKLNPGKTLPENATFHHDLLHATEHTITIDGKKTKVLVGKMHLIPTDVNQTVFHQGSASVARKYYQGLGADMHSIRKLARKEASLAATGGDVVRKAAKKIAPGKIARGLRSLVGRNVVRLIPLVGTGLAIVDFAENAEAHGIGGAVLRATPVLGDLVSAADLGTDLAKQITDEANAALDASYKAANAPVAEAWHKASEQTVAAFRELAPQIHVTNTYGPNGRVDPREVAEALKTYRKQMHQANYLKASKGKAYDFDAAAADAKRDLKERLTKAAQKTAPPARGRTL